MLNGLLITSGALIGAMTGYFLGIVVFEKELKDIPAYAFITALFASMAGATYSFWSAPPPHQITWLGILIGIPVYYWAKKFHKSWDSNISLELRAAEGHDKEWARDTAAYIGLLSGFMGGIYGTLFEASHDNMNDLIFMASTGAVLAAIFTLGAWFFLRLAVIQIGTAIHTVVVTLNRSARSIGSGYYSNH